MIQGASSSVMDFGAVGDGVADDTAAIQAAINNSQVLFFPAGTYRITDTLTFPQSGATVIYGVGHSSFTAGSKLVFDHPLDATPFINIDGNPYTGGFQFEGLWFYGSGRNGSFGTSPNVLVKVGPDSGADDRDVMFRSCKFENSGYGIHQYGRGLTVEDCTFITFDYPIYLDYPNPYSRVPPVVPDNQPNNAFRAIYIRNNRAHSCKRFFIYNIGYFANKLYGLHVTGNFLDSDCGMFRGGGNSLTFSANTVINMATPAFDFQDFTVRGVTITGNTFAGLNNGDPETAGTFTIGQKYTIESLGTTDFTLIGATSNTLTEVFTATGVGSGTGTAAPIYMEPDNAFITMGAAGSVRGVTATGNTISNIYKSSVILNGSWADITVSNNVFNGVMLANSDPAFGANYAVVTTLTGGSGLSFVDNQVRLGDYVRNTYIVNRGAVASSSISVWSIKNTIFPSNFVLEHNLDPFYDLNQDVHTVLYVGDGTVNRVFPTVATMKGALVVCRSGVNAGAVFANAVGTGVGVGVTISAQSIVVTGNANANTDQYSLIAWK